MACCSIICVALDVRPSQSLQKTTLTQLPPPPFSPQHYLGALGFHTFVLDADGTGNVSALIPRPIWGSYYSPQLETILTGANAIAVRLQPSDDRLGAPLPLRRWLQQAEQCPSVLSP